MNKCTSPLMISLVPLLLGGLKYGHGAAVNANQFCHFSKEASTGVFWLECPGVGITKSLSIGVNHVENCDPHNTVRGGDECPPGTFGPSRFSPALGMKICPWFCDSYDTSINASSYSASTQARYGNTSAWAAVAVDRLKEWGFNSIGSWSSPLLTGDAAEGTLLQPAVPTPGLVYGYSLDMLMSSYEHRMASDVFVDVFDPSFATNCSVYAAVHAAPRKNDPHLLGYWVDNETPWNYKLNGGDDLISSAIRSWNHAGQTRVIGWLNTRYSGSLTSFNKAWHLNLTSWASLAAVHELPVTPARTTDNLAYITEYAGTYMSIVAKAIKAEDPNHMLLGSRMDLESGDVLDAVVRGAGPYVDTMDYHCYQEEPCSATLHQLHNLTGLPILISEFGFRASDSGLPNTMGAGPLVMTQTKRAAAYAKYISELVSMPFVGGYHMFMYYDEPAGKQLFGADSNFGLVHSDDDVYTVVVEAFTKINAAAPHTHASNIAN
eukprot:m.220032 g.220032  ORF g.220032 m.220032 type:complete len:491 (+) comp33308_c3_seq13:177-1649(+)